RRKGWETFLGTAMESPSSDEWWERHPYIALVFTLGVSAFVFAASVGIIRQGSFVFNSDEGPGSPSAITRAANPIVFWLVVCGEFGIAAAILGLGIWKFHHDRGLRTRAH